MTMIYNSIPNEITGETIIIIDNKKHNLGNIKIKQDTNCILVLHNSTLDLDVTILDSCKFNMSCINLGGSISGSNIICNIEKSNIYVDMYVLSILKNADDITINASINIKQGIKKVEGHLLEDNLLLGNDIVLKTIPALNVYSSDIKASHGCRIEKVDMLKMFYLQSKGLSYNMSQSLIVDGYISNILNNIKDKNEDIELLKDNLLKAVL